MAYSDCDEYSEIAITNDELGLTLFGIAIRHNRWGLRVVTELGTRPRPTAIPLNTFGLERIVRLMKYSLNDILKVQNHVRGKLRLCRKQDTGQPQRFNVFADCAAMNVPDGIMREYLIRLARLKEISLTSYCNALGREARLEEFSSPDAFFLNCDDTNGVRVRPLVAF
jgi:hypothetical protein